MGFLSHKLIYAGLECLDALGANVLAVEGHNVLRAVTEDTGRLIFLHDDIGAIDVNLETVTLCDVKSAAKLDGEDNAPQLFDFTHDTGRFHKFHPFPVDQVFLDQSQQTPIPATKPILLQRENLSICRCSLYVDILL